MKFGKVFLLVLTKERVEEKAPSDPDPIEMSLCKMQIRKNNYFKRCFFQIKSFALPSLSFLLQRRRRGEKVQYGPKSGEEIS